MMKSIEFTVSLFCALVVLLGVSVQNAWALDDDSDSLAQWSAYPNTEILGTEGDQLVLRVVGDVNAKALAKFYGTSVTDIRERNPGFTLAYCMIDGRPWRIKITEAESRDAKLVEAKRASNGLWTNCPLEQDQTLVFVLNIPFKVKPRARSLTVSERLAVFDKLRACAQNGCGDDLARSAGAPIPPAGTAKAVAPAPKVEVPAPTEPDGTGDDSTTFDALVEENARLRDLLTAPQDPAEPTPSASAEDVAALYAERDLALAWARAQQGSPVSESAPIPMASESATPDDGSVASAAAVEIQELKDQLVAAQAALREATDARVELAEQRDEAFYAAEMAEQNGNKAQATEPRILTVPLILPPVVERPAAIIHPNSNLHSEGEVSLRNVLDSERERAANAGRRVMWLMATLMVIGFLFISCLFAAPTLRQEMRECREAMQRIPGLQQGLHGARTRIAQLEHASRESEVLIQTLHQDLTAKCTEREEALATAQRALQTMRRLWAHMDDCIRQFYLRFLGEELPALSFANPDRELFDRLDELLARTEQLQSRYYTAIQEANVVVSGMDLQGWLRDEPSRRNNSPFDFRMVEDLTGSLRRFVEQMRPHVPHGSSLEMMVRGLTERYRELVRDRRTQPLAQLPTTPRSNGTGDEGPRRDTLRGVPLPAQSFGALLALPRHTPSG